ncbi:MAG: ABC transporter substrate-binding protein, partial [Clostridia bacterium]|nr:ABC transporter substrate-binding protein [Clostridia bacterium]
MKNSIKVLAVLVAIAMICVLALPLAACDKNTDDGTITDMIGRKVSIVPGSYSRIVCIGAGALRLYAYLGDTDKLVGVEDIDNLSLSSRPRMFDNVARPYVMAIGDSLTALPSAGVGGPNAQSAEAEKILLCNPDLVISEYEDADKENTLQEQLGVPVVTVKYGSKGVFDANVQGSLTLLGKILGKEEKAATLCAFINAQKAEIERRTANVEGGPSVYLCGLGNWGTTNH